jgi:hypothetical protein
MWTEPHSPLPRGSQSRPCCLLHPLSSYRTIFTVFQAILLKTILTAVKFLHIVSERLIHGREDLVRVRKIGADGFG